MKIDIQTIGAAVGIIAIVASTVVYAENTYEKAGTAEYLIQEQDIRRIQETIDLIRARKRQRELTRDETIDLEFWIDRRDQMLQHIGKASDD